MASKGDSQGGKGLSRRQFLKLSAAGAAVGTAGFDWALRASTANAADVAATYHTTCPYCSASCGQLVDVDASGNVLDIYGDPASPLNGGGLCAKGAGSHQLVTNLRRLGVPDDASAPASWRQPNPTLRYDASYTDGIAWKRTGNGAWGKMSLDAAMAEIGPALVSARGTITPGSTAASNSKAVQFFGSSHMNNEQNYLYRKIIANFGTSLVEHQARI